MRHRGLPGPRNRADHANPRRPRGQARHRNGQEYLGDKMSKIARQLRGGHQKAALNGMFGKLMSISDDLMWRYYGLLTDFASPRDCDGCAKRSRTGTLHPMDAKMQLAHAIIAGFHGEDAVEESQRGVSSASSASARRRKRCRHTT